MKIFKFVLITMITLIGVACNENSDNKDNNGNNTVPSPTNVVLKVSSDYMVADGDSEITFTVLGDDVDMTQEAIIYDQKNNIIKGNTFSTTTAGTYSFWAAVGTTFSQKVKVVAIDQPIPELPADPQPESTNFAHRTLILQYTGTQCGYCPYMIQALEQLASDETYGDKFCLGACHDFNYDDPMYFGGSTISGAFSHNWPHAVVGFTENLENSSVSGNVANLKKAIDKVLKNEVKAGLAVNSELVGNSLAVSVELKAAITGSYSVGCWVLEDGIEAYQNGSKGNIIHNNAIRSDCTPYNGNKLGTVDAGQTAQTLFSFKLKNGWVKENCRLVVFACYPQGSAYIITNATTVPLNTELPYEYK